MWRDISQSTPFKTPGVNSNGEVAFLGRLAGGNQTDNFGAWSTSGGTTHLVGVEGSPVSGLSGVVLAGFRSTLGEVVTPINRQGDLALRFSYVTGLPGSSELPVVFLQRGGTPQIVAQETGAAADLPGLTYAGFDDLVMLNGEGHVAFRGQLQGPGVDPSSNAQAIWAQDQNGILRLIVREGDQLQVAPGDIRTVSLVLLITGSGDDDGRRSSFTDDGRLAFYALFTDGSDGMFLSTIATVPEPRRPVLHCPPSHSS